jgi:tetratricopeptide (TPR) repeat protein
MVIEGLTRVLVARGELRAALDTLAPHVSAMPTPDGLALEGDLLMALGRGDEAERSYRLAEAAWTSDAPEPSRLARFLAGRGRRLDDAIDLARREATVRNDIFTLDALAWALFRSGRVTEAAAAIEQALRLGTRDRVIRYHAAAIDVARGERRTARIDLDLALSGSPNFDLVAAPEARLLLQGLADVEDDR